MSHEQRLIELKKKIDEARLTRAKLEQQRDSAENTKAQLLQTLKSEYGVDSVEQAKELLATMGQEFNSLFQQIQDSLERIRDDGKLSDQ